MDIEKVVQYWAASAEDDLLVAEHLLSADHLWSLFAAHLAVEKILKAAVVFKTGEHAPPIHNLLRLAHGAGVVLKPEQEDFLAELNRYNIEARYPRDREALRSACDREYTAGKINEAREFVRWIRQRF